jgi:predicted ABC-type ATPase
VTGQPEFWIVAGVNGAGKSTASSDGSFGKCLNPDAVARKIARVVRLPLLANYLAVVHLERVVARSIEIGESVAVETVLSTPKYLRHGSTSQSSRVQGGDGLRRVGQRRDQHRARA